MAISNQSNAGSAKTAPVATGLPTPQRAANRLPKKRWPCSFIAWAKPVMAAGALAQGLPNDCLPGVRQSAQLIPEPTVPVDITELEFGDMEHFLGSKNPHGGSGKPWTVIHGEVSPGSS